MNHALCNSCEKLAPAETVERDGKVYLVKSCPDCGPTETLVSSDARRYHSKRSLDAGFEHRTCKLNCLACRHGPQPGLLFVDVTNRCNLNCPICINNTPSMGFLFEPPIEYFDAIFKHYSTYDPPPAVQLFGGEPTVRDDLFDIIALARSYGLSTRVVTNGLKLADEDYCRRLIESKATILIAYDGANPETYRFLRGSAKALDLKHKALDNIGRIGGAKVTLMTLAARGFNDHELPDLFAYCHDRRDYIRAIYFMPLAHSWDSAEWDFDPERTTTEDIESIVDEAFPDHSVEFLPAGFPSQLPVLRRCLRIKPLPFLGVHPNCESSYLLISDGARYVPASRYLKSPLVEVARALRDAEQRLAHGVECLDAGWWGRLLGRLGLKDKALYLRGFRALASVLRRHGKPALLLKGRSGRGRLWHGLTVALKLAFGVKTRKVLERHTNVQGVLQLVVLPFEDKSNIETDRLERCPCAFAFMDPADGRVKDVPVCAWGLHKTAAMRKIMAHYAVEPSESVLAGARP